MRSQGALPSLPTSVAASAAWVMRHYVAAPFLTHTPTSCFGVNYQHFYQQVPPYSKRVLVGRFLCQPAIASSVPFEATEGKGGHVNQRGTQSQSSEDSICMK